MKNIILKIAVAFGFISCSSADTITVDGIIKIKGSSPHTYLVIEDNKNSKEYKISNTKKFNLQNLQNREIKAKVKIVKKAVGAGFPAVVEVLKIN